MPETEVVFETASGMLLRQPGAADHGEFWLTFGAFTSREPAAAGYIGRRRAPALHVVSKADDWWQHADLEPLFQEMERRLAPVRARVVSFGVSMGAFGALLTSRRFRPDLVIAGCPQVLVDPALTNGHDERWRLEWETIRSEGALNHPDARLGLSHEATVLWVHDPFTPEDRWHAAQVDPSAGVRFVNLPFAGHEVFKELLASKLWPAFMDAAVAGSWRGVDAVARTFNRGRRSRFAYWFGLGRTALSHRRPELATTLLRRSLELEPASLAAAYFFSVARETVGDLAGGIEVVEAALPHVGANPTDWEIYHRLAHLYVQSGDLDAAEEAFRRGLRRLPDSSGLHGEMATFLAHRPSPNLPAAIAYARRALDLAPGAPQHRRRLDALVARL